MNVIIWTASTIKIAQRSVHEELFAMQRSDLETFMNEFKQENDVNTMKAQRLVQHQQSGDEKFPRFK